MKCIKLLCICFLLVSCLSLKSCKNNDVRYKVSISSNSENSKARITNIDFFLETSVSMKGYVNANALGNYSLKEVVPFLITDLNTKYNNAVQIYTVTDQPKKYPKSNDEFVQDLRSGDILGGKSSELQNVFGSIIDSVQPNSVSILVTDCIVDLGKKNTYTESSLVTQKIYKHLTKKENFGVALFQYESDFNGDFYFDRNNTGGKSIKNRPYYKTILRKRPFYVWVFGEKEVVKEVLSNNIFGTYSNSHFFNLPIQNVSVKLLENPKQGKVAINQEKETILIREASEKRPVIFTLGFNLNNIPTYYHEQFKDANNFQITPKYINDITSLKITTDLSNQKKVDNSTISQHNLSHFLQVQFSDVDVEVDKINIQLTQDASKWFEAVHIDEDFGISAEELEGKTFALKCITDAFKRYTKEKKELLNIQLTKINK